jgi:HAD superfamily hydrolase (TIGR01549 family)
VEAVLFDFSGTLMRSAPPYRRVAATLAEAGISLPDAEVREWAERLDWSGGLPGGHSTAGIPERFRAEWERRDLDPAAHRGAYTNLIKNSGWPWPELADAVYDRCMLAEEWAPYPDSLSALSALRERGIRTAVVSNIGWDPRTVLEVHGVTPLVDAIVLSYEEGCAKPDPAIFTKACARLGVEPEHALMVGDDRRADGGAAAVGIRVFFVDPVPVEERPDGFAPLLAAAGIAL